MVNVITRLARPQAVVSPPGPSTGVSYTEFLNLKPSTFSETTDPARAEGWLEEMEGIFSLMRKNITTEEKVDFTTYLLRGDAKTWWKSLKLRLESDRPVRWDEFRTHFLEKYFSENLRFSLEQQFMELRQQSRSVIDYESEFNRLSQYAPTLVMEDQLKARRFTEGLIPPIRKVVKVLNLKTFREVVRAATNLEE